MPAQAVRLRPDLVVSEQTTRGTTAFVLKDPTSERFFRLGEIEHFIARQLDGTATLDEIRGKVESTFGAPLPAETLTGFVSRLRGLRLIEDGPPEERREAQRSRRIRGDPLYLRVKAFDPERLFARLAPGLSFLFTPSALVLSLGVVALGTWSFLTARAEIGRDLARLAGPRTLFLAWLSMFFTITAHEFAHGLTCTRFGGKVREVGFMLIYFQPAFYCNVSDAWMIRERSRRLWVTFAGAYVDVVLWALGILVWRVSEPGSPPGNLALIVMATCGIRTLFNLNPLIKLDGYYLLSDWLEIPNLRRRAFGYLRSALLTPLGRRTTPQAVLTSREKRIYISYALLSGAFSTWLLSMVLLYIGGALIRRYQGWGFLATTCLLASVFRYPLVGGFRSMTKSIARPGRLARSAITFAKVIGLFGAVAAILYFGQMEMKVSGEFRVLPAHNADVRTGVDGIIESIEVREGSIVRAGDRIARISDRDYQAEMRMLAARIDETQARLKMLQAGPRSEEVLLAQTTVAKAENRLKYARGQKARMAVLFEQGVLSRTSLDEAEEDVSVKEKELEEAQGKLQVLLAGSRPEEIEASRAELSRFEAERKRLGERLDDVSIVSPITGVVTTPKIEEMVGRHIERGDLIAKVYELNTVSAEIAVDEKDISDVRVGGKVELRTRSFPDVAFEGTIEAIAPTVTPPGEGEFERAITVTTRLKNDSLLLRPEMTGNAKIHCGRRRLYEIVTRRLARYLRVEFWSWW